MSKRSSSKSRESLHLRFAPIIYAQTKAAFPRYSHPNSPKKYTLPQLAACVLLSFYFKMSYRDFVELVKPLWRPGDAGTQVKPLWRPGDAGTQVKGHRPPAVPVLK